MKEKIFTLAIALFAVVWGMQAQPAATGAGTSDDPRIVYTPEDLVDAFNNIWYIQLGGDINLGPWITANSPDIGWMPVSWYWKTLDGNGHTISGLWSHRGNDGSAAFISQMETHSGEVAAVKDLTIVIDDKGIDGAWGTGGLIATVNAGDDANGTVTITNVHLIGNVSSSCGSGNLGGIVGNPKSHNIIIDSCSVKGTISGAGGLGGIVGTAESAATVTITNSYFNGTIQGNGDSKDCGGLAGAITGPNSLVENCYANVTITSAGGGGLIGTFGAGDMSCSINNCYVSGSIHNGNYPNGGIVSTFIGGSIQQSFSSCTVTNDCWYGTNPNGGIAGEVTAPVTITQCYNIGDIIGGTTGGIVGVIHAGAVNSTISECYASGQSEAIQYSNPIYTGGGLVGQIEDGGSLTIKNSFALNTSITGSTTGVLVGAGSENLTASTAGNFALENLNDNIANTDGSPTFITETQAETQETYTVAGWDFDQVWMMKQAGYPVFKGLTLVIGPTDIKTASDYTDGGYSNITFVSDGSSIGQLVIPSGEELTVTGVVKLQKTFTKEQWYAIGFPFAIASVRCDATGFDNYNLLTFNPEGGSGNWGDYWLKTYDGATFEYYTPGLETIAAGGYILQVPPALNGATFTFTSTSGVILSNPGLITPTKGVYQLTYNPSVANFPVKDNGTDYFYAYDGISNFGRITEEGYDLKPFESAVVASGIAPESLRSSLNIDGVTALPALDLSKDKPVATEYYNLMGVKVLQPVKGNIYLVKTVFESGRTSVVKQFIKNN